jgi:arylsulfatase A-like enzyme
MHTSESTRPPARLRRLATLCASLVLAACDGGPKQPPKLERPNIVLITIDTLRADHLGCYGYFRNTTPHIDALAKESVVFEQAYATMATTLPSHTSMFTARYPLEHGIFANIRHGGSPFGWKPGMMSFAQVAKEAGYTTGAFISAAALKHQCGIDAGFDVFSEPTGVERKAGETIAEVLPWLEAKAKEPFLLWVHFYDPHWKHKAPPPYDTMFHDDKDAPALEQWIAERQIGDKELRSNARKTTETRGALNDYCGEVAYADSQFGVLIDELEKRALLDKSIVIFCADHGEGLNQHKWTAHGLVWEEQLRVPFILRFPPQAKVAPQRVAGVVSLIDMFPTVLARVKPFETPMFAQFLKQATGVDALSPEYVERPIFGQRTEREMAEDPGEMYAVTTPEWKYIHEPEAGDMLFDRRKDPFELDNLLERQPETAARVHSLMELMMSEQKARGASMGEAEQLEADPELLRQLRETGYAGGDDGRGAATGSAPDTSNSGKRTRVLAPRNRPAPPNKDPEQGTEPPKQN